MRGSRGRSEWSGLPLPPFEVTKIKNYNIKIYTKNGLTDFYFFLYFVFPPSLWKKLWIRTR